jgi:V/A-type H+-transporting ATPase subunit D
MALQVTRMELLRLRRRRDLAQRAKDLLEEKRTILVMELLRLLGEAQRIGDELDKRLSIAYEAWTLARTMVGEKALHILSVDSKGRFELQTSTRSVAGTQVPMIKLLETKNFKEVLSYDLVTTPPELDMAVSQLEEALKLMVEEAEVEATIKSLATKLESLKRRVNALEHIILPKIESNIKFIQDHLEEMDRESFFRLKRIKSRLEKRRAAASAMGSGGPS